jgi:hypothetical protein
MKRLLLVLIIILYLGSMMCIAGQEKFGKGAMFVSPVLGVNSYAIPFGASIEYGINDKIGVGGTILFQTWGEDWSVLGYNYGYNSTLITPSVQGVYHFTGIKTEKIDAYAGLNLGFSIFSFSWEEDWIGSGNAEIGSSSLYLTPFAGIRFYLSAKMALTAAVNFSAIGDWSGVGTLLGVCFKLK